MVNPSWLDDSPSWLDALDLHTFSLKLGTISLKLGTSLCIDASFAGTLVGLLERTITLLERLSAAATPFVPPDPVFVSPWTPEQNALEAALTDANLGLAYLATRLHILTHPTHCRVCGDELACNDSLGECRNCQWDRGNAWEEDVS